MSRMHKWERLALRATFRQSRNLSAGKILAASRISSTAMRWLAGSTLLLTLQPACPLKRVKPGDGAAVLATSGFVSFSSIAHSATPGHTAARQSLSSFVTRCGSPSTISIAKKQRPSYRTSN